MTAGKSFTINSLKFDGTVNRSWNAESIRETKNLLLLRGVFESEINHPFLGFIRRGTISYEFFWRNRGYNVFRFHEPEGVLRNFYCNINQPPIIKNNELSYVDLDIDVLVWNDSTFEVLDLDEFEENAEKFGYSPELRKKVQTNLNELLKLIKTKAFPFNYKT